MWRRWPVSRHNLTITLLASIVGFAALYTALDASEPGVHFNGIASGTDSFGTFLYYSLTTQASVGYGDISPRSSLARALVSVQMLGTLLLGLYIVSYISSSVASDIDDSLASRKE